MGWVIPLISALAPVVAGVMGNNSAKSQAAKMKKQNQPLLDMQMKNAAMLQPYGERNLQQGQQHTDRYGGYLNQMTSGNNNAVNQAIAPQINAMTQANQGAVQAQRNLYGRGLYSTAQAGANAQNLQGSINNMRFGAVNDARDKQGQLGLNQQSLGMGMLGQGSGMTNSMLNYGLNAQQQMMNQGYLQGQGYASMGQGVTDGLKMWMANRPQQTTQALPSSGYSPYPSNIMTPGASAAPPSSSSSVYSSYQPTTPVPPYHTGDNR